MLNQCSTEVPVNIKPYRLLTSLFDKPQIGPVILDSILYDVFRALYLSSLNQQKHKGSSVRCVSFNGDLASLKGNALNKHFLSKNCQELVKNANLLFNTLETYYIWLYIGKLYEDAVKSAKGSADPACAHSAVNEIGSGSPTLLETCILAEFLLDIVHIETYVDNTSEILPDLFVKVITVATENIKLLNKEEITHTLQLCMKVLTKIQPITIKSIPKTEVEDLDDSGDQLDTSQADATSLVELEGKELKVGLEKSKSDSKINENISKNELTVDDSARERSNSNQMLKRFKSSPKIDKKSKGKKSKSSPKLYEIKKEEDTDSAISESLTCEKMPEEEEVVSMVNTTITENKHIVRCLKLYKKFYVEFIQSKITTHVNTQAFFSKFVHDKDERTKNLEQLLDKCLLEHHFGFHPERVCDFANNCCRLKDALVSKDSIKASEYEEAMSVASSMLLEFSGFPNLIAENDDDQIVPYWLKALIVAACCWNKSTQDLQIIAMNTILELFSLAKSQNFDVANAKNTNVVMGFLRYSHVLYIEGSTLVLEVSAKRLMFSFFAFGGWKQKLL